MSIGVDFDDRGRVFVSGRNVGLLGKMFGGTIAEVMSTADADLARTLDSVAAR